jgi:hypothetical protein
MRHLNLNSKKAIEIIKEHNTSPRTMESWGLDPIILKMLTDGFNEEVLPFFRADYIKSRELTKETEQELLCYLAVYDSPLMEALR